MLLVAGLARNCVGGLYRLQRAIHSLRAYFTTVKVCILENGSTDDTWSFLEAWARKDSQVKVLHIPDHVPLPENRMKRLGMLRNKLLRWCLTIQNWKFLLMTDCDLASYGDAKVIAELCEEKDWDVLTAWGHCPQYAYSDIFALRTEEYPYGPLEVAYYWSFTIPSLRKYWNRLPKQRREVLSAFGWSALYRYGKHLQRCQYGEQGDCEHVLFNACLRKQGFHIYVEPRFQVKHT